MSETKNKDIEQNKDNGKDTEAKKSGKKTLSLGGTLSLKNIPSRPSGSETSRGVAVEVRRKRKAPAQPAEEALEKKSAESAPSSLSKEKTEELRNLTDAEREARIKALQKAGEESRRKKEEEEQRQKEDAKDTKKSEDAKTVSTEETVAKKPETPAEKQMSAREKELEELQRIQAEEEKLKKEQIQKYTKQQGKQRSIEKEDQEEEESYRERMKKNAAPRTRSSGERRRSGKLTVTQVLNEDYKRDRGPSLAAQRRAREKARMAGGRTDEPPKKVTREVTVPESITVQELANRMAEKTGDVVKKLMNMGVMATINQPIDADTAELIIEEFGHKIKRVSESDVEFGIEGPEDKPEDLKPRPPVVTIMGHVDHGKTSLLDALRQTDVVGGEAGGITQHIGAYQVTLESGGKITFIDTPGHAAFTEMRSRGANVTDIVVLVVAANDGLMPQTIEAINHSKAAEVPMIVAINKMDLPDADPQRVKTDLLQHEVVVEDMGGDVLTIEVSALQKTNLDKLEEAILLQAEILELKANPDRDAVGAVVEAKLEQGRGNVATVLIQSGTLKIGDIFVIGSEWGKVRAMIDDHGKNIDEAVPGQPVEILGLNGAPEAGDRMVVVKDENRARQISSYRQRKKRDAAVLASASTFEELLTAAKDGSKKQLPVIIKGDVHGSIEAIAGSLAKIEEENPEVAVNVLHSGVGGITESDVTLAKASNAMIIGFNVRANAQARRLAEQDGVNIHYYNIIYNIIDDAKALLSGMLEPIKREEYLGQAEIRQVFNITKVGKVAGCMVKDGVVKRGSGVRLLRDDVVIHEGTLKTLKRFQDEVKEVKEGMECGMAFENYDDIKDGDIIECYEIVEEARSLE